MSDSGEAPENREELPKARVVRRRWHFSVIWIVPLIAAVVAGYLVYGRIQEFGPKITIKFKNGNGITAGQTPVKYRGVQIGEVTAVELSDDHQDVVVKIRLARSAASIARDGTVFWIVRPEVGLFNVAALGTVFTGPEIEVLPGSGKPKSEFVGLENAPLGIDTKGLKIILVASRARSLRPGSPIYYHDVEVGLVQDVRISTNAATVEIQALIRQRYARLVKNASRFWNVSGVDINFGLLKGLEINMESLRALLLGGIAFATPNDPKDTGVKNGAVFPLYDKPEKEWLEWAPPIKLPPA